MISDKKFEDLYCRIELVAGDGNRCRTRLCVVSFVAAGWNGYAFANGFQS